MTIEELRKKIFADGILNDEEVQAIESWWTSNRPNKAKLHGAKSQEFGNFLFDLKNIISKDKLPESFKNFYVDTITSLLIDDENTPGEIDESEARWLRGKIQYNGTIDTYDRALLKNLRKKSINFPKILQPKSRIARIFENSLYGLRYFSIIAVIFSSIASIILFMQGALLIWWGCEDFINNYGKLGEEVIIDGKGILITHNLLYENLFEKLVSCVDIFLFALVLIIFSVGVYELFISKIDPVEKKYNSRPSWLRISSVDDLKSSLGKVVLMVLIVSFFKHTLEIQANQWSTIGLLQLGCGIALIALALYLTHKSHNFSNRESSNLKDTNL